MRISDWSSDVCSSDLFLVEGGGVLDRVEFAVDADAGEAGLLPLRQFLAIFALAAADHRGEEIEAGAFGELHHAVDHLADRLRADGEAGGGAVGNADARPEEAHIVVDLRHGGEDRKSTRLNSSH